MAIASARKKFSKRLISNSKPQQPSPQMSSSSSAMAFPLSFRKIIVSIPVALIFMATVFFSVSSISQKGFESNGRYGKFFTVEVINEFPHDPEAFTQGLLYAENDTLFESTGLYGHSSVRKVALKSGKVEVIHRMKDSLFGEGLTLLGKRLHQVIWLEKTGFIYDRNNLSKFEQFTHEMKDGWGLATDDKILFGSDGTSTLYQIDPRTFKAIRKHTVKYKGLELHNLNELEYINGEVWANVYQTDCIARISPKDGTVLAWILLPNLRKGLLDGGATGIDVLNGIAWDKERSRLFVTGKNWPKLFEIKLHPMKTAFKGDIERMCMPAHFQFARP